MKLTSFLLSSTLALANVIAAFPTANTQPTCCNETVTSNEYHEHIVNNYVKLWYGDLSVLNQTISPVMSFHGDRFPESANRCSDAGASVAIKVTTSYEFGVLVAKSRVGFSKYGFKANFWFGQENKIAIRWSLDAVIGDDYTRLPITLKPGDPVTYNGTEILVLNKCTGLVDEVDSAQDLIDYFHNLGLTCVTV